MKYEFEVKRGRELQISGTPNLSSSFDWEFFSLTIENYTRTL